MSQTRHLVHVDRDDQLIGHITPDERRPHHIYRVSALWLTNSRGEILLAQRHIAMANSGGLWGPAVAGTVEVGESYLDNIVKETAEEIGLTGVEFRLGPKVFVERRTHGRNYFCQWFFADSDWPHAEFVLEPGEVDAVRWIAPQALRAELTSQPQRFIPSAQRWIGRFI